MSARASRFVFGATSPAPTPDEQRDMVYRESLERRLGLAVEQLTDEDVKALVVISERLVRARETP